MKTISRYYLIWMTTSVIMFFSLGIYLFLWLNLSNVVFGSVGVSNLITNTVPFLLVFLGYFFYKLIKRNSVNKNQKNENILKFIYGVSVSSICSWILISIYNEIPFLHFRLSQSLGAHGSQLILTLGITLPTFLLIGMCWRNYFEKITKTKYFITSTIVFNMFIVLIGFTLSEKYLLNFSKFENLFFIIFTLGVTNYILLLFITPKSDKLRTGIYIGLLYLCSLIPVINLESLRIGFNLNNYNQTELDTEKLKSIRFDSQDQVIFQNVQFPYLLQGMSRPVAQGDFIIKQNGNIIYKSPDLNQSNLNLLSLLVNTKTNDKLNVIFFKFESFIENIDFIIDHSFENFLLFDSRLQFQKYILNFYNQNIKLEYVDNSFNDRSNEIKKCSYANIKKISSDSNINCFLNLEWKDNNNLHSILNEKDYHKSNLIISVENNLNVMDSIDSFSPDYYSAITDLLLPDGLFYQKINFRRINNFQYQFILESLLKNFKNISYIKIEENLEIIANNGLNSEEFNDTIERINQNIKSKIIKDKIDLIEYNNPIDQVALKDLKNANVDIDNDLSTQMSVVKSYKWYQKDNRLQGLDILNENQSLDLNQLMTFKFNLHENKLNSVISLWQLFGKTHPYEKQKVKILEQIIEVGSRDDKFKALVFLSELYLEKSEFVNSYIVARKLQKYFPSRVEAYFLMSESLIQSKKIDLAKEILKVGIYYLPDNQRLNSFLKSLERVY